MQVTMYTFVLTDRETTTWELYWRADSSQSAIQIVQIEMTNHAVTWTADFTGSLNPQFTVPIDLFPGIETNGLYPMEACPYNRMSLTALDFGGFSEVIVNVYIQKSGSVLT